MTASWKAVISFACVAAVIGAALSLWLRQKHAVETKKLFVSANEIRTRAEQGDAASQNQLGNLYLTGRGVRKDYAEAVLWYTKGAEQGNSKAEFNLGEMYKLGEGVAKDYAEALHWLRKSADQSDTRAEIALGHMYFNGEGVTRDECQGFAWYRKAAESGYLPAQQFVGWMYYYGRGVQQDYTQAAAWYEKAANQGDAFSQASLGYMYAYGLGVERDRIGSLRYYRTAATKGEPNAIKYLSSIKPTPLHRNVDLAVGLVSFFSGLVFVLPFSESLIRKKGTDWRQGVIAILGVAFLAIAVLNLYGSAHDIRYWPRRTAFLVTRRALEAIALLIIVTVVLPGVKKHPVVSSAGAEH